MAKDTTKVKKVSRISQVVTLIAVLLVFGLSFGPAIVTRSDGASIYECTNFMFRGVSGGLLSAFIFVSLAILFAILTLVFGLVSKTDRNGNKLNEKIGDNFIGFIEILEAAFMFTAGMLFSITRVFAYGNIKANGGNLIDLSTWNFIGWAAIVIAIVCFLSCLFLLYSGTRNIGIRAAMNAEEEQY